MNDSPTRDQLETESLDPEKSLVDRRRTRDEQDYRDWCESLYGPIELGQEIFHPADVLGLAVDAARRGRDDAAAQIRADLEQAVCNSFPAPIAVPFQSFLEGARSAHMRLLRLRDTWESMVRLLVALALSEAVTIPIALAPLVIRDGKDQGWRPCKRRDLLSDKLSVRIGLIEGILHRAKERGVSLQIGSILPLDVLAEIRRLNVVRNGFSHEAAKSETQARNLVLEVYPVFREVLVDLRRAQDINLLRLQKIHPGGIAEIEELTGHAQSRRIREIRFDVDASPVVMSAAPVDGMDRILARLGEKVLDLSPFLYAADDDTGHRTRVMSFKFKEADEWHLECVADSTTTTSSAAQHEMLLTRFEVLLGQSERGA